MVPAVSTRAVKSGPARTTSNKLPSMQAIGRLLQVLGLGLPLLAIFAQLSKKISVGEMLAFLVAAMCLFWIGNLLGGGRGA